MNTGISPCVSYPDERRKKIVVVNNDFKKNNENLQNTMIYITPALLGALMILGGMMGLSDIVRELERKIDRMEQDRQSPPKE